MEPIDYAGALRRSWRLLILLALVVGVIAVLLPVSKPHSSAKHFGLKWASSALVGSAPNSSAIAGGVSSEQIQFYAQSLAVENLAAREAKQSIPQFKYPQYFSATLTASDTTAQPAASSSTTTPPKKNQATLVLLTAYGKTANDATNLANSWAGQLQFYLMAVALVHPKTSNGKTTASAYTGYQIQQYAEVATRVGGAKSSLTSSRKVRLIAGLIIGAVIGAAIVLLRELLDKHIRSAARAEANFEFPVVAEIPIGERPAGAVALGPAPMVDVVKHPDSPGAEAFRKLRMSVMFEALAPLPVPEDPLGGAYGPIGPVPVARVVQRVQGTGGRAIVLVVSAGNEPSRPHVAANLAAIYAESGQRVAVISTGSVESGSPVVIHGPESNEIRPEDVAARMEPSRLPNVFRLPLDSFIGNSGQLVMRAPSLLKAAASLVDLVIVETPPLLAVHHAEALSHAVDAVLVVAECRVTTFDEARRAGDRLRRIEAPVLGVVLTNVNVPRNDIRQAVPRHQPDEAPQADPDKEPVFAVSGGIGSTQEPATPPQA